MLIASNGHFLDADPATCAQILIDYRFLLSGNELDCISSIKDLRAKAIAWYSTIIWFTVFLVERSYT